MAGASKLHGFRVEAAGGAVTRLPFLAEGTMDVELRGALTFLVGENGSGKTTLLEAIAARCGIRPGGGDSYAKTEEREGTAASGAVSVRAVRRIKGVFLRADRFEATMARAGRLPMVQTGEWRLAEEQSRGEGVLSLLAARVEASEGQLYLLDEPETGLSPQRQMALFCLLDGLVQDGRSQALVATHSPILMSHPAADILWVGPDGIERRPLEDVPHWRNMRRFMRDPEGSLRRLME